MKWSNVIGRLKEIPRQNLALLKVLTQVWLAVGAYLQLEKRFKPIRQSRKFHPLRNLVLVDSVRYFDEFKVGLLILAASRKIAKRWTFEPLKKYDAVRVRIHFCATTPIQRFKERETAPLIPHISILVYLQSSVFIVVTLHLPNRGD